MVVFKGRDLRGFLTLFKVSVSLLQEGCWTAMVFSSPSERTGATGTFLEVHREETSMCFLFQKAEFVAAELC